MTDPIAHLEWVPHEQPQVLGDLQRSPSIANDLLNVMILQEVMKDWQTRQFMAGQPTPRNVPPQKYGFNKALLRETNG